MTMSDQVQNIKLVSEVEKRPVLYNNMLPDYARKDITEKAWSEVAREVRMSVSDCKDKWRNLRAVFVRHMRPHLSGTTPRHRKPYYLSDAMQFTLPFIKAVRTPPEHQPYIKEEDDQQQYDDSFDQTEESNSIDSPASMLPPYELPSAIISQSAMETETYAEAPIQSMLENRPFAKPKLDEFEKTVVDYLKSKKNKIGNTSNLGKPPSNKNEGHQMFLLSLLPDMEIMSDGDVRELKIKILQTIQEILSRNELTRANYQ